MIGSMRNGRDEKRMRMIDDFELHCAFFRLLRLEAETTGPSAAAGSNFDHTFQHEPPLNSLTSSFVWIPHSCVRVVYFQT